MSWFAHAVACALYALGFGAYFQEVLPLLGIPHFDLPLLPLAKWLAVAVVAVFAYINYRGASETGGAGNVVTLSKIVVLAVFIGFGVWITLAPARLAFDLHPGFSAQRHGQRLRGDGADVHRLRGL